MTNRLAANAAIAAVFFSLSLSSCGGDADHDAGRESSVQGEARPTLDAPSESLPPPGTFKSGLPGADSYLDDLPSFEVEEVDVATPTTTAPPATDGPTSSTVSEPEPPRTCEKVTLHGAFFPPSSANLTDTGSSQLDLVAEQLLDGSTPGDLVVVGWTDPRGTDYPGGNEALSLARALAVTEALVARGVPVSRLGEPLGMGPDPADISDADRRRVEIHVLC